MVSLNHCNKVDSFQSLIRNNILPIHKMSLCAFFPAAFAGLSIWPSFHVALSNASVFVDFSTKSNGAVIRSTSLSLVNMETNTTLLTRILHSNQSVGRVEFNCSCFLNAGTFRFLFRQTSISGISRTNGSGDGSAERTTWWWSSELQVQWPTFHIAVDRAGNHSGSFQVGISTSEHFQACSSGIESALFLEVSYMEYNQIGRNSIDKVRARTRHPIKPLRSQSVELACAFPFTEKDFIRVALRSPHAAQDVKSSGALYLSRIFSYKLLVENSNAYRSGCEGTMTVKLITPPCAHIIGKVLLYKDAALLGLGAEEPTTPPLAFNWLTQGENETEFNCSVFYPGRNKYCFRFVFNFSRSPSPAQTCLVVHRSTELWGPWQPWSLCSVTCGEGVRERVRECLLPSGVGGKQCNGMLKEQSICSLEDCVVLLAPSPSLPPVPVRVAPLGGNLVVVIGISLCLVVILATVVVTVWRKLCQTPQCSSVRRGSMHSPGGRKLSDEASICAISLQRPSLSDGLGPPGLTGVSAAQKDTPILGNELFKKHNCPSRYRLAQQQLKEMKKKGLKEATQLYHVSSSPVNDTLLEISASPTNSPISTPTGFAHPALPPQDDTNHSHFRIAAPFSESPSQTSRVANERLNPRAELILGPHVSSQQSGGASNRRNSYHKNPNFRRTSSFNETKPQPPPSARDVQGISGIRGPAAGPANQSLDPAERAEQNWYRRGPSPIQRNILARKLKEAQSNSGVKGRQRSSTFSVSSSGQRKGRCHSLNMSGDSSAYRLSEAEQRMLDLDLSSAYVGETQ
uniref:Uncharacterized protein n=1 Tax=Mola mola TaxID=94237 RepID=A0A3Q4AHA1_MOLML